jgi:hypothetical protein
VYKQSVDFNERTQLSYRNSRHVVRVMRANCRVRARDSAITGAETGARSIAVDIRKRESTYGVQGAFICGHVQGTERFY